MIDKTHYIKQFEIIDEMTQAIDRLVDVIIKNNMAYENFKNHIAMVFDNYIQIIGKYPPIVIEDDLESNFTNEINIYKSFSKVTKAWEDANSDLINFFDTWDDYTECWQEYYDNMRNSESTGLMYICLN